MADEYGKNHTGGHHFNWTIWEVLNEPNGYTHYPQPATETRIQIYARLYDGVTSVLHRVASILFALSSF